MRALLEALMAAIWPPIDARGAFVDDADDAAIYDAILGSLV